MEGGSVGARDLTIIEDLSLNIPYLNTLNTVLVCTPYFDKKYLNDPYIAHFTKPYRDPVHL